MRMPKLAIALVIALAAGAALAQDKRETPNSLDEAARRALETVMESLRSVLGKIPTYEAPVVLENGDILIRRKRPAPDTAPDDSQTRT